MQNYLLLSTIFTFVVFPLANPSSMPGSRLYFDSSEMPFVEECSLQQASQNSDLFINANISREGGQNFEACADGILDQITIEVATITAAGNAVLTIATGFETKFGGNVIHTQDVDIQNTGILTVDLNSCLLVSFGDTYAFSFGESGDFIGQLRYQNTPSGDGDLIHNGVLFSDEDLYYSLSIIKDDELTSGECDLQQLVSSNDLFISASISREGGQNFKACTDGFLKEITVYVETVINPGNAQLTIATGLETKFGGNVIHSQPVPISATGTLTVVLNADLFLNCGNFYAFSFGESGDYIGQIRYEETDVITGQLIHNGVLFANNDLKFSLEISNDSDGDGIPNSEDNCLSDYNPDQADSDGDGTGDVCDSEVDAEGFLNQVTEFVIELELSAGNENSLLGKLTNALDKYCDGKLNQALNKLNAFVNQVTALSGNKLTESEALYLINQADLLAAAMSEGSVNCNLSKSTFNSIISHEVSLHPNPTTVYVDLVVDEPIASDWTVFLMDLQGRVIQFHELNQSNKKRKIRFFTEDLSPGMYYIKTYSMGKEVTKKLIIH